MDSNVYGPALPPGFQKNSDHCDSSEKSREDDEVSVPKSGGIIGPQLPPHLVKQNEEENNGEEDSEKDSKTVIGPALPPGFALNQAVDEESDSDSDSIYGPMPAENNPESVDGVVAGIEKRAIDMKKKLQGTDKPVDNVSKREEWMTLPATDYKNQFGVISRCLVGSEQKSSNKRPASALSEEAHHSVMDEKMKEELDKYNKTKRPKSLLEMHQKSKKQKKDKESKPKERKAFDRDAELGVRLMDQQQVNSVIRNAKRLDSRFSAGASQYL